jgi:hypothetical protein
MSKFWDKKSVIAQILEPQDMEKHWFFRLKGTDKYYHHVNDHFEFKPGLNGACMFDEKSCENVKYMLATEETELVKASELLPVKS